LAGRSTRLPPPPSSPTPSATVDSDPFGPGHPVRLMVFTQRAVDSGLLPSMGSIGDCYDNAVIQSFWSRMQIELLYRLFPCLDM
jgi:hypothetical protein